MKAQDLAGRELATILAALRVWQGILADQEPAEEAINAIASGGGMPDPLTVEEIDALCKRLNLSRKENP